MWTDHEAARLKYLINQSRRFFRLATPDLWHREPGGGTKDLYWQQTNATHRIRNKAIMEGALCH